MENLGNLGHAYPTVSVAIRIWVCLIHRTGITHNPDANELAVLEHSVNAPFSPVLRSVHNSVIDMICESQPALNWEEVVIFCTGLRSGYA
jgi:hypothetical protein